MLGRHLNFMAAQLVDSSIATTRTFWRVKVGYPQFADDPRPLAACAPEIETTLSEALNEA